ncbi:MAG: cytochrome c oxidase subunit II [Xenococcaceae cyanobacterium MO_188.B19]|nr:cytochrome c oxidase subunit II [Xenococcaceae cyanobacterium MO_188.B19]
MKIPSNIVTLIAGITLTLISLWYGQNHGLMPIAASAEASEVDGLFNLMMTIATGLFLLVEGVIIYSVIKFRRKEGDTTDGPPIEGNVPLEIVWTAIPTVIVFILAIYSFEVYNTLGGLDPMASHDHLASHNHNYHEMVAMEEDNSHLIAMDGEKVALGLGQSPYLEESNPLNVNVNGIQYAWIFTYPDTGIVSGELHVPVDRPVQLNMSAGDVLHAFWLPEFRIKQDVIPGRDSQLTFTPTKVGQYPVICAELCGAYHGGMKTTLTVHSAEDYQQWLQDNTIAQTQSDANVALNQ